jgi:hypothetical protein
MSVFLTGKYKVFENGNEIVPSSPQVQFCVEGSNDQYDCVNGYNNLTTKSTTYKTNTNLGIAINPGLSVKYKFIDGQRSSTDYSVEDTTGSTITNPQTQDYNNFTPTDYNLDFFLTSADAPEGELVGSYFRYAQEYTSGFKTYDSCGYHGSSICTASAEWYEEFGYEIELQMCCEDTFGAGVYNVVPNPECNDGQFWLAHDCYLTADSPGELPEQCKNCDIYQFNWFEDFNFDTINNVLNAPDILGFINECMEPSDYASQCVEILNWMAALIAEEGAPCGSNTYVACEGTVNYVSIEESSGCCPIPEQELTCEEQGLVTCWDGSCAATEGDCPIDTSGFKELNTTILHNDDVYVTMVTANDNHTFQTIGNQYFDPYTADIVSIIGSGDGSFNIGMSWDGSLSTFESYDGSTHQGITDTTYLINVKDEPVNLNVYLNDFGSSRLDYWEPPTPTISVTEIGYNSISLLYYGRRPQLNLGPRYFIFEICNHDWTECEVKEDVQDYLNPGDPQNTFGLDPTGNCATYCQEGENCIVGECVTIPPNRTLTIDGLESNTMYNYRTRHEMRYGDGVGTIEGATIYGNFTTSSPPAGDVLPPTNIQWDESYTTSTSARLTWEWTE